METLNGRLLAAEIKIQVKEEIKKLGATPGLTVILVGNDPASHLYVSLKEKACAEVGINFEKFLFPENIDQETLIIKIKDLNNREDVHGILVQLPLPSYIDENTVVATIDPKKDVDGFHPENLSLLINGEPRVIPGIALGIVELIRAAHIPLSGKKAVLLVNSHIFAAPIEFLLKNLGAVSEIIIAPQNLQEIKEKILQTDILVVAIGRSCAITSNFIRDGVILIDVGTNRLADGKVTGDIDFDYLKEKTGWITPVPGGVGPMTVAMLLRNVIELFKLFLEVRSKN